MNVRVRIHQPLFAGFVGVLGVLVLALVLLVGRGVRSHLLEAFETGLSNELSLGEWILEQAGSAAPDSVAREVTARIGYRVTIIDTTGVVLGDSYVLPSRVGLEENHRTRPEVVGALEGGVSFSERTSATVHQSLLYGAQLAHMNGRPVILRIAAPLTLVDDAVQDFRVTVAVIGLFVLLLALVLAHYLSRAMTYPLVALVERVRRLASGDFDESVPTTSRVKELHDLALAFNRLGGELEERLSELGQERDEMQTLIDCMGEGVIALTEDARLLRTNRAARELLQLPDGPTYAPISTLVRHPELRRVLEASVVEDSQVQEVRLGGRNLFVTSRALDRGGSVTTFLDVSELRRLEQVRRDFVANASHELKTPLTSIRGFAETLLEGEPPEHLKREFLDSIRKNTLRLQRLVDDLLDLSRLESGGWSARLDEVAVAGVAGEAWEEMQVAAAAKEVAFSIEGDARAMADRQGLVQIFRNLFENSLRHTDEGGRIQVHVDLVGDEQVRVEVIDDGEGMPSKVLPRIFERFFRADASRARDFGGTGLGLAIVRHLVGAMGGEVEVESELGKGTLIRFTLPRA
jgi:two-component system phosphate regulon sensor histidine kinase PhoR